MKKSRKVFMMLITVFAICMMITLSASAETEGNYEYSVSNSEATVTKYIGNGGDVVIPDKLGGYPVVSVSGFSYNDDITSLTIPNSVKYIDEFAFYGCAGISNVKIGSGVTNIGMSAFASCYNLKKLEFMDCAAVIGVGAFQSCRNLETIDFGDNVTSIDDWAFYDCNSLVSIVLPDSIRSVDNYAFQECTSLKDIKIGTGITSININAFYNTNIENVYIKSLESWCNISGLEHLINPYDNKKGINLYLNDELITDLVIPDTIESIEDYAFSSCYNITLVTIPSGVTNIGNGAFYCCENLTEIKLENGLKEIGDDAFRGCIGLESVEIPDSVITIGDSAFSSCENITDIVIGNSVEYIGDSAFSSCNITSVIIPDSVIELGPWIFSNCYNLQYVELGGNLTEIGENAFEGCYDLISIDVVEYNEYFSSKDGVLFNKDKTELIKYPISKEGEKYIIPDSVIYICNNSFEQTHLNNIEIPNGVVSIGSKAFSCSRIENIDIPDSVMNLGDYSFYFCDNLKSITLGDNVEAIGEEAFYPSIVLEEINVSESNTHYSSDGGVLFNKDRTQLIKYPSKKSGENYVIPNSVINVDIHAFQYCRNLKTLTLSADVEVIGYNAFGNCINITDVYFLGTEEEWKSIKIGRYNEYLTNATIHYLCAHKNTKIINVIEASCSEYGYTGDEYCIDCKTVVENGSETPKSAHSEEIIKGKDSTCTTTGLTDGIKCAICSEILVEQEEIQVIEHSHEAVVTAPTCTANGYTTYTCSCGDAYVADYTDMLGHAMGEFVVIQEATCTINGEERADCSRCDYYETKELITNNHKDENLDGTCDYCNEYIADKDCICICHAKTIGALVYKIFKTIDKVFNTKLVKKVFGITDICVCGIKH